MAEPTTSQLLADLIAAYPRQSVSADTLRVYRDRLGHLPPALLAAAVHDVICTRDWFPTVSEVLEAAVEIRLGLPREHEALAQVDQRLAWSRDRGGDRPALHPLVDDALALVGGLRAFRTAEEPTIVRGQFARVYRDARSAAVRDAKTRPPKEEPRGSHH